MTLLGAVEFLQFPVVAFVRAAVPMSIPHLTEVDNLPVRYLFLLLGPLDAMDYHEVGRSISTMMSNEVKGKPFFALSGKVPLAFFVPPRHIPCVFASFRILSTDGYVLVGTYLYFYFLQIHEF